MTRNPLRGRPRVSSRATLEDAANELFLEQGYDATSITDIAQRAGVSRTSFFSYFPTKADVLWSPIDEQLILLNERALNGDTLDDALDTVFATGSDLSSSVGLLFSDTIGAHDEILASAMPRLTTLSTIVARFAGKNEPLTATDRAQVYATTGRLVAAWREWLATGTGRASFTEIFDRV